MAIRDRVTEDRALKLGPHVCQGGFTLTEMVVSLVVLSIVGLGAYSVMQSSIGAQLKLERTVEKGFGSFNFKPRNLPLQPLKLGFTVRPGWFRVPSTHAVLPDGQILGDLVVRSLGITILGDDARLENPVWIKCEGDNTVIVNCSKFENGKATVTFKLNDRTPSMAIARVQAEWPSLPSNHPYKRSPEYVYTTPLSRDCPLTTQTPNAPKYLLHNNWFIESVPPGLSTCTEAFRVYVCYNGIVTATEHQRVCK